MTETPQSGSSFVDALTMPVTMIGQSVLGFICEAALRKGFEELSARALPEAVRNLFSPRNSIYFRGQVGTERNHSLIVMDSTEEGGFVVVLAVRASPVAGLEDATQHWQRELKGTLESNLDDLRANQELETSPADPEIISVISQWVEGRLD